MKKMKYPEKFTDLQKAAFDCIVIDPLAHPGIAFKMKHHKDRGQKGKRAEEKRHIAAQILDAIEHIMARDITKVVAEYGNEYYVELIQERLKQNFHANPRRPGTKTGKGSGKE